MPGRRFHSATAAPVVLVQLDKDRPGTPRRNRKRVVYRLDVFPGTHTAIIFRNVGGGPIVSNNPNVVDSGDRETWLEKSLGTAGKKVFFHARATFDSKNDTTLFLLDGAPAGSRVLFQVRRAPFPPPTRKEQGFVRIRLNGRTVALNQDDGKIHPYILGESIPVKNNQSNVKVLDELLKRLGDDEVIDHLVVNAHGSMGPGGCVIQLGDHFHRGNLHLWQRLKKKVRYIWFQGCVAAADVEFMHGVALRTGAWVSGVRDVEIIDRVVSAGMIDLTPRVYSHFNTVLPRRSSEGHGLPRSHAFFYQSAVDLSTESTSFDMESPEVR